MWGPQACSGVPLVLELSAQPRLLANRKSLKERLQAPSLRDSDSTELEDGQECGLLFTSPVVTMFRG